MIWNNSVKREGKGHRPIYFLSRQEIYNVLKIIPKALLCQAEGDVIIRNIRNISVTFDVHDIQGVIRNILEISIWVVLVGLFQLIIYEIKLKYDVSLYDVYAEYLGFLISIGKTSVKILNQYASELIVHQNSWTALMLSQTWLHVCSSRS